jgi:hypothetical protein
MAQFVHFAIVGYGLRKYTHNKTIFRIKGLVHTDRLIESIKNDIDILLN